MLTLNKKGIVVKNSMVSYDSENKMYHVYWKGGDGNSYLTTTEDFSSFSDPEKTEYQKEEVTADLPAYAQKEEAAVFEFTQEEYDKIHKKYGKIESVVVHGAEDRVIKEGEQVELPKHVEVEYSDGSAAKMGGIAEKAVIKVPKTKYKKYKKLLRGKGLSKKAKIS